MTHPLLALSDKLTTLIDTDLATAMDDLHRGKLEGYDAPDDILAIWNLQDKLHDILANGDSTKSELEDVTAALWAATGALEFGRANR